MFQKNYPINSDQFAQIKVQTLPSLGDIFFALLLFFALINSALSQTVVFEQARLNQGIVLSDSATGVLQQLPHNWNNDRPQRQGVYTYHITFNAQQAQLDGPSALYFMRLGNRYQIWLNDQLITESGSLNNPNWGYINTPLLLPISKTVIKPSNQLRIVVSGDVRRYAGLSSVQFGNIDLLRAQYQKRYFFQQLVPYGIIFICLSLAILTFLFGIRNKNRHVFIFGVGSFFWSIATAFELFVNIPFDYRFWLFLYDISFSLGISCLALSFTQIIKFKRRWFLYSNYTYLLISFCLIFAYVFGFFLGRHLFLISTLLLAFLTVSIYFNLLIRKKTRLGSTLLTVLAASAAILGLYDQLNVFINTKGYEVYSLVRYVYLVFALAVFSILSSQYFRMTHLVTKTNVRLHQRLSFTKIKLLKEFEIRAVHEKSLSLSLERARMMQDMHDGLGSQLIGLQHAVKNPYASPELLGTMVKNSITELRLAINALGQNHTQVSTMLGALRERLELLFQHQQRNLVWAVDDIPILPELDSAVIAQLEKIVLELFTNIAKHSSARTVSLFAAYHPNSHILICITEDGDGYALPSDTAQFTAGKGLANIMRRAHDIGAVITTQDNGRETLIRMTVKQI